MRARGQAERAVQRVRRELGRVALGGGQPAQLALDLIGADPRRVEQRRTAQQGNRRAAGRENGTAAARVEARLEHAAGGVALPNSDGDPHQIAARGTAGGTGAGAVGHEPAALRVVQVLLEALGGRAHANEFKGLSL